MSNSDQDQGNSSDDQYPELVHSIGNRKRSTDDASDKSEKQWRKNKNGEINSLSEENNESDDDGNKSDKGTFKHIKQWVDPQEPAQIIIEKRRNSVKHEIQMIESIQEADDNDDTENTDNSRSKNHVIVANIGLDNSESFNRTYSQKVGYYYINDETIPEEEEQVQTKLKKTYSQNSKLSSSHDKIKQEFQFRDEIDIKKKQKQDDTGDEKSDSDIQTIKEEEYDDKKQIKGIEDLQKAIQKIHVQGIDRVDDYEPKTIYTHSAQIDKIDEEIETQAFQNVQD